jgi:hypothetical protein
MRKGTHAKEGLRCAYEYKLWKTFAKAIRTMTDSDNVGSASEFSARVILDGDALAAEIVLEIVDELQLLLDREPTDDRLKH